MAKFNEDTRVKIPATIQFLRLGYDYQSLKDIDLHTETRIAVNRFKPAIEKINGRSFSDEEIQAIIADILSVIKNNDLGKTFYKWLINPQDRVKLIDFDCIENNNFAVVDELTFGKEGTESEKEGSFRPDITVLINGIPLAFLEVKHPNNEGGIQAEFNRMDIHELESKIHSMVDDLQGLCSTVGLSNTANEEVVVTSVFLYKFLNDKFMYNLSKFSEEIDVPVESILKNEDDMLDAFYEYNFFLHTDGQEKDCTVFSRYRSHTRFRSGQAYSELLSA